MKAEQSFGGPLWEPTLDQEEPATAFGLVALRNGSSEKTVWSANREGISTKLTISDS